MDNAVKFTPGSGEVRLAVAVRSSSVVISVEDTGPGVPAMERDKVLRRFYRAERSRHQEGNGLGLSLVAAVAQLHGFGLAIGGERGCVAELTCSHAEAPPTELLPPVVALALLLGALAVVPVRAAPGVVEVTASGARGGQGGVRTVVCACSKCLQEHCTHDGVASARPEVCEPCRTRTTTAGPIAAG